MVNTIKQGFGFIQPLLEEEQIYFAGRDITPDMKVGDRVAFLLRDSVRGLAAENVRLLSTQTEKVIASVKGTVSRCPDRHRSNHGLITVDLSTADARSAALLEAAGVKEVCFLPADVLGKTMPKTHRLDKGDFVELSVQRVVGSGLHVARNVSFLQLKRDRALALQIQRMLDAGVVREQGVVTALKKGEYGFIKPLDRKEEIYFRLEDPTSGGKVAGAGDAAAASAGAVDDAAGGKGPSAEDEEDEKLVEVSGLNLRLICCTETNVIAIFHSIHSFQIQSNPQV